MNKMSIEELKKKIDEMKVMPDWIALKLSTAVLTAFLAEIKKVFKKLDGCDWKGVIDDLAGTQGWVAAFKITLENAGLEDVWMFYDGLEWWESDLFGGEVTDLMIKNWDIIEIS